MDKKNSKTKEKAVQTCSNWSTMDKKLLAEKGKQLLKEFILKTTKKSDFEIKINNEIKKIIKK